MIASYIKLFEKLDNMILQPIKIGECKYLDCLQDNITNSDQQFFLKKKKKNSDQRLNYLFAYFSSYCILVKTIKIDCIVIYLE